jgi:uncharacterized protein (DUF2336 family)
MLRRPGLPVDIRQAVAVALSEALSSFVVGCGWLSRERSERVVREAREKATVALTSEAREADVRRLVAHLRRSSQLTPALILRALLSRAMAFAEAAFAELTDMPLARVSGLLQDRRGSGFPALYKRAGLPPGLRPAFQAALSALHEPAGDGTAAGAQLSRRMVERALSACAHLPHEEASRLLALLRRYEVEAAREEARDLADSLAQEAALEVVMDYVPDLFGDGFDQRRLLDAA